MVPAVDGYRSLQLADVYAVISRYLANPAQFDEYLRQREQKAAATRREIKASGREGPTKEQLIERARTKGSKGVSVW